MSNKFKETRNFSSDETHIISVKTNLGDNDIPRWIKLRRNNVYTPYKVINDQTVENLKKSDNDWTTVSVKKKEKPIYYWVVDSHNLFDRRDKSFRAYFIDPDSTQIENIDQTNYMAMDTNSNLRLVHSQLKYGAMKMNPTFFIARTISQIKEALSHTKYCVVKIENNEQKLIESPSQLLSISPPGEMH